ncbi:thermonuclease family protein [Nereida sp. MMG025]|uniref:thermonuclease family protein n=1 Tax=Nereida sp. MMG025 TaxID=2909981 RepID=UPI001F157652|nr:thermonuclease family protein [Nereida sp. MMG025]MCF6443926.1 thermonuclease family protein [Nereida sp. MMG025]
MLTFCALFGLLCATAASADITGPIRVIDGDTFDVGTTRVRIHGIDAVEIGQTCQTEQGTRWDCGTFVKETVRARYDGIQARCERIETDRYGRAVAKCFVADEDIGATLVSDGLALAYREYSMDYDLLEKGAAVNDRGLWAGTLQNPSVVRAQKAVGRVPPNPACNIKGNISANGQIYHMPGDKYYERTGIRTERGERWFCSAAEADAAGWVRAKR